MVGDSLEVAGGQGHGRALRLRLQGGLFVAHLAASFTGFRALFVTITASATYFCDDARRRGLGMRSDFDEDEFHEERIDKK